MLAIKLQRRGKKHQPSYRVVVQEKRSKLNGDFIDDLGFFNPKNKDVSFNKERLSHWMSVGAKPTPRVHNLLVSKGLLAGKKIPVHKFVPPVPVVADSESTNVLTEAKEAEVFEVEVVHESKKEEKSEE